LSLYLHIKFSLTRAVFRVQTGLLPFTRPTRYKEPTLPSHLCARQQCLSCMRPRRLSESLPSNGEDSATPSIQDASPVERLQTTPTSLRRQPPRPCPCVQSLRVRHATARSQRRSGPVLQVLLRAQDAPPRRAQSAPVPVHLTPAPPPSRLPLHSRARRPPPATSLRPSLPSALPLASATPR
jgi:hypothetical protein